MSSKIKKPFYKKWWFILLVTLFIFGGIMSQDGNKENVSKESIDASQPVTQSENTNTEAKKVIEETIEETVYVNTAKEAELFSGKFVVGEDIEPGRYVITCDSGNGKNFTIKN